MYFETIVVCANQGKERELGEMVENALNNYLVYGDANTSSPARMLQLGKAWLPKPREVKHMQCTQVVINMTIWHTTVLCCDGDLSETYQ